MTFAIRSRRSLLGFAILSLSLPFLSMPGADAPASGAKDAATTKDPGTTTQIDGTGTFEFPPDGNGTLPTSITVTGKAVTAATPAKKEPTKVSIGELVTKVAGKQDPKWKVVFMPAASRLAAKTVTLPDPPSSADSKSKAGADNGASKKDDAKPATPKPEDVTPEDLRAILRSAKMVMIAESDIQDHLREDNAVLSADQLAEVFRSAGIVREEARQSQATWLTVVKEEALRAYAHKLTYQEARMVANLSHPKDIDVTEMDRAVAEVRKFNKTSYHIGCTDGELVVMRHQCQDYVAAVCFIADRDAKDIWTKKLEVTLKSDIDTILSEMEPWFTTQLTAVFDHELKKALPGPLSDHLPSEAPALAKTVKETPQEDLAKAVATDVIISFGEAKTLLEQEMVAVVAQPVDPRKPENGDQLTDLLKKEFASLGTEMKPLDDQSAQLVRTTLAGRIKGKLLSLSTDILKEHVSAIKSSSTGLDAEAIVNDIRKDTDAFTAQSCFYDKASLTLTKRSPAAALILPGLLGGWVTGDDGLHIESVPLDGDGRFLVYFPLENAWSSTNTFSRPYSTTSTDPTLVIGGILDTVKGAVADYSADAGLTPEVSAKATVDILTVDQAISSAVTLTSSGPNKNFALGAVLDTKFKDLLDKIATAVVASVKANVNKVLDGEDYAKWLASLKKSFKGAPASYTIEEAVTSAAAPPVNAASTAPTSDAIRQMNNAALGRPLQGLAPDTTTIVVPNSAQAADLAIARSLAIAPLAAAAAPAAAAPAAAAAASADSGSGAAATPPAVPKESRIPTLFAGSVWADVPNNALDVVAPPFDPDPAFAFMKFLNELVGRLDAPRKMIEISVAIADIQTDLSEEWGTTFAAVGNGQIGNKPANGVTGFNLTPGNSVSSSLSPTASGAAPALSSDAIAGQGLNVGGLVVGSTVKMLATFHALELANKVQMLARPSVLTTDNSEAVVTDETKLYLSAKGLNTGILTEVPSGLAVAVTPQIVDLGEGTRRHTAVRMRIKIKEGGTDPTSVTTFPGTVAVDDSQLKTTTLIEQNQSLLIAGRLRHEEMNVDSRIPILGRIPLLGRAFKNTTLSKVKHQRLILVTPTIVDADKYHSQAADQAAQAMMEPPLPVHRSRRQEAPAPAK